jgi:hypothetical protein
MNMRRGFSRMEFGKDGLMCVDKQATVMYNMLVKHENSERQAIAA